MKQRFPFLLSKSSLNSSAFMTLAASLALAGLPAAAQTTTTPTVTGSSQTTTDSQGQTHTSATLSADMSKKKPKESKADRLQQTNDTKAAAKKQAKLDPLAAKDASLPDKQLYDKAIAQTKSGHYDVARLDLQTLLNTYPDSQYEMRAKLAVADSWYEEGGTAALAQAEQEYTDFITFFPNVPEAAEAQMRVGDIYFKQMDVPDRDYSKAVKAEEGYRTMLKQYPDAPPVLLKQVRQKLREVQEVLATREAQLGQFYMQRGNITAAIARYQTVVDTYPQYSHMDDVLIGIGDEYAEESKRIRGQNLPEGPRAKLLEEYDGLAAAAYRKVVVEHSAAPHVEDAKERLASMNLPIPSPTPEQAEASEALEGSRAQYTLSKRLSLLVMHKPDTVTAAQAGDPPLEDPPATVAPTITKQLMADYVSAFHPEAAHVAAATPAVSDAAGADATNSGTPAPEAPATPTNAPLALGDVLSAGNGSSTGNITTLEEASPASRTSGGTGLGVEVLTPGATVSPVSSLPAATGAPDPNGGLTAAGPKSTALPPVEKAADAPDQVNDVAGVKQPPAEAASADGKKKAPAIDKKDESSSKEKKKKGLDKLNPF